MPWETAANTWSALGCRVFRFGPTTPAMPASASVWQTLHAGCTDRKISRPSAASGDRLTAGDVAVAVAAAVAPPADAVAAVPARVATTSISSAGSYQPL